MVFRYLRNWQENKHNIHCKLVKCTYKTCWRATQYEAVRAYGGHLKKKHPEEITTFHDIVEMFGPL